MTKSEKLNKVAKEIEKCKICKIGKFGKAVPGEGKPDAKIIFIGEAPGRQESTAGRPFVGRSGQYLTRLIESTGLDRKDVFITSPVKYYPVISQKGRTPSDTEIAHGKIHLVKQLEIIKPKIIVLLGRVAAIALLGKSQVVSRMHGKLIKQDNKTYFLTYHPAAAIRFQKNKALIEEDFRILKRFLNS